MNEDINERLKQYLDAIESAGSKAGDFIAEQTPILASEALAWHFYSHLFGAVAAMVLGTAAVVVLAVLIRKVSKEIDDELWHGAAIGFGIPLMAGVVAALATLATCSYEMVKVTVAPRVVLVEQIKELSR